MIAAVRRVARVGPLAGAAPWVAFLRQHDRTNPGQRLADKLRTPKATVSFIGSLGKLPSDRPYMSAHAP